MTAGREATHGFVSQTSNACLCGLMLADCEVASRDAYKVGRETARSSKTRCSVWYCLREGVATRGGPGWLCRKHADEYDECGWGAAPSSGRETAPDAHLLGMTLAERVAAVLFEHEPDRTAHEVECEGGFPVCQECEQGWPCDAVLLARQVTT